MRNRRLPASSSGTLVALLSNEGRTTRSRNARPTWHALSLHPDRLFDSNPVTLPGSADLLLTAVNNTAAGNAPIGLVAMDGAGSLEILDKESYRLNGNALSRSMRMPAPTGALTTLESGCSKVARRDHLVGPMLGVNPFFLQIWLGAREV